MQYLLLLLLNCNSLHVSKLKTSANQQITHIRKGREREVKGKVKGRNLGGEATVRTDTVPMRFFINQQYLFTRRNLPV